MKLYSTGLAYKSVGKTLVSGYTKALVRPIGLVYENAFGYGS